MRNPMQFVLLLVILIPSVSLGITARDTGQNTEQVPPKAEASIVQEEKVYLLSWQDDYMRTTAGTIYVKGLKIIEHVKIDRDTLNSQDTHFEVKFTRVDNQIKQVDIYPHR